MSENAKIIYTLVMQKVLCNRQNIFIVFYYCKDFLVRSQKLLDFLYSSIYSVFLTHVNFCDNYKSAHAQCNGETEVFLSCVS